MIFIGPRCWIPTPTPPQKKMFQSMSISVRVPPIHQYKWHLSNHVEKHKQSGRAQTKKEKKKVA